MTICCFPNCAYLSETSRMIAVYRALRARGENALIATHGGTYQFVLDDENIPYILIEPHMSDARCRRYVAKNRMDEGIQSLREGFYSVAELREHVKAEIAFFRDRGVKAVLSGFTLSNALSARAAGVPYAVTHLASMVPPVFERNMLGWPLQLDYWFTRLLPERFKTHLRDRHPRDPPDSPRRDG